MIVRIVAAALVAAGLCSCAPQTATLAGFSQSPAAQGFTLTDGRAAPEKTEWLSLMVWSCDNGIRRLGDEVSVPSRLDILRRDLGDALGPRLQGKTVTVKRYTIFYNMNAFLAAANPGASSPVGAALIATGCPKEKVTGGWYDLSEVTNAHSPVVVDVEVALDGKSFSGRAVLSPDEDMSGAFGKPYEASVLFEAMRRAHAALIANIKAG